MFLNTLYLQDYRHLPPFHAGLYTLPIAVMTILFAPFSGRLVGRGRARLALLLGGLGMTLGPLLLVGLSASTSTAWLLAAYVIFGFGFGVLNPPITATAVGGMPAAQAGVAAAVASSSRQLGQTLGVAVIGALATGGALVAGSQLPSGFISSSHVGWWILVGCGLTIMLVGFVSTGARAAASARRTAAELGGQADVATAGT